MDALFRALYFLYLLLPLWMPIILVVAFYQIWMYYIRLNSVNKDGELLLEIKLPREITKSPAAMELVFTALHQGGAANFLDTFLSGKTRPWFSFEMVSIEGQVRFFIWTKPRLRRLIEAQIYAQYPGVEIHDAEDYTKSVFHKDVKPGEDMPFWGTYFKLTKADVYPIKTYIDYGLDRDPKEEFKIDPMTSVLEYLGSLRKGEQAWIQILIQAHRKEGINDARFRKRGDWTEPGKAEIKKLIGNLKEESKDGSSRSRQPTKGESDVITSLERSLTKLPFETAIRGFYITEPGAFNPASITGLIGSFRQYSSANLNGFKLGKNTGLDYPWQDFRRVRRNAIEKKMLDAYKRRSFFQVPYRHFKQSPFILNTEELATIFHFPGQVATTPTIQKAMSKKAEPPPNLPV